jgi:hypothetical protein
VDQSVQRAYNPSQFYLVVRKPTGLQHEALAEKKSTSPTYVAHANVTLGTSSHLFEVTAPNH